MEHIIPNILEYYCKGNRGGRTNRLLAFTGTREISPSRET